MGDGQHLSVVEGDGRKPSRDAQAAQQAQQVFQLVASGLSVVEAARQLAISTSAADRLFHQALADAKDWSADEKRQWLHVELETLRLLQRKHMSQALKGSIGSAQIVLQVQERRSKYMGLDEAMHVKVEHGIESSVVEDIRALLDEAVPLDLPELPEQTLPGYGMVIDHDQVQQGDAGTGTAG